MTRGAGRRPEGADTPSELSPVEYPISEGDSTVTIQLPPGLLQSLPDLRRQLEDARREANAAAQRVRELGDLIASIERFLSGPSAKAEAPAILVGNDQFKGKQAAEAVKRIMLANDRPFRVSELADILYRGGQSSDMMKIRQNVAAVMKYARQYQWLVVSENDPQAWKLSESGRAAWAAQLAAASEAPTLQLSSGEG